MLLLGKTVAKFHELTGSYNTGIVVYVVTQMTVMALLFSWVLEKLKKFGSGTVIGIISFLFLNFSGNPHVCTVYEQGYALYGRNAGGAHNTDGLMPAGKRHFGAGPGKVLGLGAALLVMAVFRSDGVAYFCSWFRCFCGWREKGSAGGWRLWQPLSLQRIRASGRTQCSAASGKYRCDGGLYSTYPAAGAGMEL